jgi:hypothetical protein
MTGRSILSYTTGVTATAPGSLYTLTFNGLSPEILQFFDKLAWPCVSIANL